MTKGRKKLPDGVKKGERVFLRLSVEEKARYEAAATKGGIKLSAWIRRTLDKNSK